MKLKFRERAIKNAAALFVFALLFALFSNLLSGCRNSEIKVYEVKTSSAAGKTSLPGGATNKRIKDPALNETIYLIVSEN